MTDIIFCENTSEVSWIQKTYPDSHAAPMIVALTPEAAWACQQRNLAYRKLEEFYDQQALYAQRGTVFRQTYEWIQWLDGYIDEHVPSLRGKGFHAATAHALVFQLLFDELFANAFALKELFRAHPGATIRYGSAKTPSHQDILVHKASVIPHLLPTVAAGSGVTLSALTEGSAPIIAASSGGSLKLKLLAYLRKMNVAGELTQIRYGGWGRYIRSRRQPTTAQDPVLVLGSGYDIDFLVMALREQGAPLRWIQSLDEGKSADARLRKELAEQWTPLLNQASFWKPLTPWGIGRNDFFAAVVRFWWDRELPEQGEQLTQAAAILEKHRYKAVVSWETISGSLTPPILQAAEKKGIQRVIYQHGSTFRIDSVMWYRWLHKTNLFLAYGEGTAKQLRDTWPDPKKPHAKIQAVGSARLDAIAHARSQNKEIAALRSRLKHGDPRPLILYVPTLFGSVGRALSDLAGYPDVSYFELQQNVFKIFSEFPQVRLLYKDMATRNALANPLPEMLRTQIPNATVIKEEALIKLFWAVDAIIVDHAVTALGEALLTSKPLLVYDPGAIGSIPEPAEARALLRKRATVSETGDDFQRDVRRFLQEGQFSELAAPNTECLDQYGTYLHDGQSAQRAAQAILAHD